MKKLAAGLVLLVPIAGAACSKKEAPPPPPPVTEPATTLPAPASVTGVTLGKAIGADKKVTEPADAFGAKDTIYASVDTAGTGHAKLRAVWTFVRGEKTAKVDETTLELDATGPATNEFHIAKPSGWPKGDYRLDVFLNDGPTPVMTKAFKVG
jgi:hypothetical protein